MLPAESLRKQSRGPQPGRSGLPADTRGRLQTLPSVTCRDCSGDVSYAAGWHPVGRGHRCCRHVPGTGRHADKELLSAKRQQRRRREAQVSQGIRGLKKYVLSVIFKGSAYNGPVTRTVLVSYPKMFFKENQKDVFLRKLKN